MTRAALENAVRAWLVAAGAAGGLPNADRACIIADQDGTRPPLPYLVVKVLTHDNRIGEDELIANDSTPPKQYVRGQRFSTVSVNAYGETALGWLQRATLKLRSPSVLELNTAAGIAVQTQGGPNNLSGLRDSHSESRWQQDFRVDYETLTDAGAAEEGPELATVEREDEWQSTQHGDRTETVTVTV